MKNILPGWEIVEKIGQGGFSTVYKIKKSDSAGDGEYYAALKVITIPHSPEEYDNYAQDGYDDETITAIFTNQVKKLEEEFRLMSRFKGNSNIVSYEDHMIVSHDDGKGWDILIRMELLEPLTKYCNKTPLNVEEIVKLGIDICRALELCKKENIIHRDIKPQNIFVNKYGDYKLGDFGIAKTMDHTTHATKTGTYTYMAPEVYKGDVYNANVDIYSLGLVLYWLLNERRLPFLPLPPVAPTANQISDSVGRRMSGEAFPAPKNGSEELKRIVLKACAFKSEDRYCLVEEIKEELENVLFVIKKEKKQTTFSQSYNHNEIISNERETIVVSDETVIIPAESAHTSDETVMIVAKDVYPPEKTNITSEDNVRCISSSDKVLDENINGESSVIDDGTQVDKTVRIKGNERFIHFGEDEGKKATSNINEGDYITFGIYKGLIIEWKVLKVIDEKALVVSRYALDVKPYEKRWYKRRSSGTSWETCTLRKWLNNEFYNTAFNSKDKLKIKSTSVSDAENNYSSKDNVFLLSMEEVSTCFSSGEERKCYATEYAKVHGAYALPDSACWWWLRDVCDYLDNAVSVDDNGNVFEDGFNVHDTDVAVRPALWINLL